MEGFELDKNILKVAIDVSELSPQQIRLLKTINSMLKHITVTDDEEDFFETSAELMKQIASLIKQANFNEFPPNEEISYAEQAIEYSLESIADKIYCPKLNTYDN
jgi:hypothetical protein